jgi:Arc/MetJ-type ribon-helix-helix transcriptional regulator
MYKGVRWSLSIPDDLEKQILSLRKTERFCRCSISEIARYLVRKGIEADKLERSAKRNTEKGES